MKNLLLKVVLLTAQNVGVFPEFHAFVSYKCMKTIAEYAAPTSPFIIKVAVEKGAQELKGRKHLY